MKKVFMALAAATLTALVPQTHAAETSADIEKRLRDLGISQTEIDRLKATAQRYGQSIPRPQDPNVETLLSCDGHYTKVEKFMKWTADTSTHVAEIQCKKDGEVQHAIINCAPTPSVDVTAPERKSLPLDTIAKRNAVAALCKP